MTMRLRTKLLGGTLALALFAGGGLFALDRNAALGGRAAAAEPSPAPFAMPVPVTKVVKRTIPITLEYSARMESIRNVSLQAKVPGYIQAQPAADGTDVREGDLLYKIDGRDYQAVLDGAKAQAQRDQATLDYARSTYDRGGELSKSGFLSKDVLEQRTSSVHQAEAALAQDRAAIRTAEINLAYTEIRAPFAGRLGRDRAPVGTLVGGAGAMLNTLVQLDPIYVTFNPSEGDLADIARAKAKGPVRVDILLPGETAVRRAGELSFIDNAVDRATGTITARATVKNADFVLLPGQYVRVRLHVREEPDALLVPQAALGSSQLGKYVYVVGQGGTAEQRLVKLGPASGELVSVTNLAEDAQVITGNLQKIGPGAPVKPLLAQTASGE
jgi:multidrug efflux system membrane fusion protein